MCGIAGLVSDKLDLQTSLKKLNKAIYHRGPDEKGFYTDKTTNVGLTSTRLSIIGIRHGSQPKISKCKNIILVFNGEIFNYQNLSKTYLNDVNIKSDTEVILKLYEKYGISFLKKLNGMFTIAILDKKKNKIFIARDRFGIKPLYYHHSSDKFVFSSEINSILKTFKKNLSMNLQAVSNYLSLGFVNSPNTIYNEINRLDAGSLLSFSIKEKKINIIKWWNLKINKKYNQLNEKKAIKILEKQLIKSTDLWTTSDVPISFLLSGGIDSGILTALFLKKNKSHTNTFSYVFKNGTHDRWNELGTINEFIKKYENKHNNYFFNQKEFSNEIFKISKHLGEPFGGGLPSWYILKEIGKKFKVTIAGVGGDELFGNYNRPQRFKEKTKDYYNFEKFKKYYFYNKFYLADLKFKKKYTNLDTTNLKDPSEAYFKKFKDRKNKFSIDKNLGLIDFDLGLIDDYLYYNDRFSMAHSVELRTPYLDHKLVELAYSMPDRLRLNKHKYKPLLRKIASKHLPEAYLDQKKKGFSAPLSLCMRGSMKNIVKIYLSKKNLKKAGIVKTNFYDDYVKPMKEGSNSNITLVWHVLMLQIWLLKTRNKLLFN